MTPPPPSLLSHFDTTMLGDDEVAVGDTNMVYLVSGSIESLLSSSPIYDHT